MRGAICTGYDATFSNTNYMGPGDVVGTLNTDKIAAAAVLIVEAVLAAVGVVGGSNGTSAVASTSLPLLVLVIGLMFVLGLVLGVFVFFSFF